MKKLLHISLFLLVLPIIGNNLFGNVDYNVNNIEIIVSKEIVIYPNPAKDLVQIEASNAQGIQHVEIYDLLGNRVMYVKVKGKSKSRFNVQNLRSGRYTVRVIFSNGKTGFTHLVKV